LATVALAVGALVSCDTPGDTARPGTTPSPLRPGLRLSEPLQQHRLDATRHMLTVPIVNGGPTAVHVRRIQLLAPHFAAVPPTSVAADMAPEQLISFSIGYGSARCDDTAATGEVALTLEVGPPGSPPYQERLAVETPVEVLDRLRRGECDQRRLAALFDVTWGTAWRQEPPADGRAARLRGALRLDLTGADEPVTATDVRGSVLFGLDTVPAGRRPIAALTRDDRSATVPIEITVELCSKHGLTEAKKVFDFSLYARIGTAEPLYRTITPPPALQRQTLALLATCPADG
jgi:hypothetical protein